MIIQIVLSFGLALCIIYAFMQRRKSRLISNAIYLVSFCGILLVAFPDSSNLVANFVGVGRGADLIVYCWIVISFLISVNLQFKILALQENITQITRQLAILSAKKAHE